MAKRRIRQHTTPEHIDVVLSISSFVLILVLSVIGLGQSASPKGLMPMPGVVLVGALGVGALFLLIIPAACAVLVCYRSFIPYWKACILAFAAFITAASIAIYLADSHVQGADIVLLHFRLSLAVSASGALLVALFPTRSVLPAIGCAMQFMNLVTWAVPYYGELP
jgi:hypothetical protein